MLTPNIHACLGDVNGGCTIYNIGAINLLNLYQLCAEIWDALHAASEAEISLAQAIVNSAGIIVTSDDLSTCYDERGNVFFISSNSYCLFEYMNFPEFIHVR